MDYTPDLIREKAELLVEDLLPTKSKLKYLKSYDDFMKWCAEKNVETLSENVMLIYFEELSKRHKPSTLWNTYSMLKSTLNTKQKVNLKAFTTLRSFLRKKSKGFKSITSKVFTRHEIETFLKQAPDVTYLVMKVGLILGISGACRTSELLNLTVDDIQKQGDILLVKIRGSDPKDDRTFVIINKEFVNIVEKYINLRPSNIKTNSFFINYRKAQCLRQGIGKSKMSKYPKEIATFLNLPNPTLYSGQCFRRTSATLLADSSVDCSKSGKIAGSYEEESVENETQISHKTTEMINLQSTDSPQPSTSKDNPEQYKDIVVKYEEDSEISVSPTWVNVKDSDIDSLDSEE